MPMEDLKKVLNDLDQHLRHCLEKAGSANFRFTSIKDFNLGTKDAKEQQEWGREDLKEALDSLTQARGLLASVDVPDPLTPKQTKDLLSCITDLPQYVDRQRFDNPDQTHLLSHLVSWVGRLHQTYLGQDNGSAKHRLAMEVAASAVQLALWGQEWEE